MIFQLYSLKASFKWVMVLLISASCLQASSQDHSIIRQWNEVLLESIREDFARPTVHARNLWHSSVLMYDTWAIYEAQAEPYFLGRTVGDFFCPFDGVPAPGDTEAAINEAISYAMYRFIRTRFINAPGVAEIYFMTDQKMADLGYNTSITSTDYLDGTPAHLGNYLYEQMIEFGLQDGANEENGFANTYYSPVNLPLDMSEFGNPDMVDPNRWQQLVVEGALDQAGNPIPSVIPFLSPEWGDVVGFALNDDHLTINERDGLFWNTYLDPGAPPYLEEGLGEGLESNWKWGHILVAVWQSHHDPADGVMIDASPANIGNNPDLPTSFDDFDQFYDFFNGGDASQGHALNPATGLPYEPQIVPRADYARVLAEFWADGPDSETPPGHWFTILHTVNDHPMLEKRWNGQGEILSDLEWDAKAHFTLGCAMHDAAIAAWSVKGYYDFSRPVSAIRYMAEKGQCTDTELPRYHPDGFPLIPGYVELVMPGDPLVGENEENLHEIKLYTWRGPDYIEDPETDFAGVGWILAKEWWPYQRPTFVTPPFAGYVSGHSTFSRTAAEVFTLMTGDEYFPGGMSNFYAAQNEFLHFEEGPSQDLFLQWATYRDASDQCSLSRIWGGIHPPADDIPGRFIGMELGPIVYDKAITYFVSTSPKVETVTASPSVITDANVGETLTISILFDRAMDTNTLPDVNFPIDDPTDQALVLTGQSWIDNTTFELTYDINDTNEEFNAVFVQVAGAEDVQSVNQTPFVASELIVIDTRNPSVSFANASDALVNDVLVSEGQWSLSIVFDEEMNTLQDPTVTFSNPEANESLSYNAGMSGWSSDSEFIALFDVMDMDVEIDDISLEVLNARDAYNNEQLGYLSANAIAIDTKNPALSTFNSSESILNDASVGGEQLTIDLFFDEEMNTAVIPELVFPNDNPMINSLVVDEGASEWVSNSHYMYVFDLVDANEALLDIVVNVEGAIDLASNTLVSDSNDNPFVIDTENPILEEFVMNDQLVSDANAGDGTIQMSLVFNEAMDQNGVPEITFSEPEVANSLILNESLSDWSDETSYMAVFDVLDLGVEFTDITITVAGTLDQLGNPQESITLGDYFAIDTRNPSPLLLTANTYLITDPEGGAESFNLVLIFDEEMNTASAPFILFPNENPLDAISPNALASGWINSSTYQAVYDVAATEDYVLNDIDLVLTGSVDLAGNLMVQSNYPDFFSINTTETSVESLSQSESRIFPNPVHAGQPLTLEGNSNWNNALIRVYSSTGQLIYNQEVSSGGNQLRIPTNNLATGMYLLQVSHKNENKQYRFQVLR